MAVVAKIEDKYQIARNRFQFSENAQRQYFVRVPAFVRPEQLEDPKFFATVAGLCHASGIMFVEHDEGKWLANVYIRSVGPNFVITKVLQVWDLEQGDEQPAAEKLAGYEVAWGGRYDKWRVIREADRAVVHKGAESREAAKLWLDEHLKAVAR